jgi:small basic protein
MAVNVSVPKLTGFGLAVNTAEALDTVVGAVIAGIALYFINKAFLNNYPAYVAIILGFLLSAFLGNYYLADVIGFALVADGLYKLFKESVTINS